VEAAVHFDDRVLDFLRLVFTFPGRVGDPASYVTYCCRCDASRNVRLSPDSPRHSLTIRPFEKVDSIHPRSAAPWLDLYLVSCATNGTRKRVRIARKAVTHRLPERKNQPRLRVRGLGSDRLPCPPCKHFLPDPFQEHSRAMRYSASDSFAGPVFSFLMNLPCRSCAPDQTPFMTNR